MTVFKHEIKHNSKSWFIWTFSISFLVLISLLFFPEMSSSMDNLTDMFKNMGDFTKMFGLDQLNMGELMGFYGVEVSNILGLGGAVYSAALGINFLSKEEYEHTAEFLYSHPVSRTKVYFEKCVAMILLIIVLNLVVVLFSFLAAAIIKESYPMEPFLKYHISVVLMHLQLGILSFGISAFLKRNTMGLSVGVSMVFYFINLLSKLSSSVEFLKYFTPFYYADPSLVIAANTIDVILVVIGYVSALVVFAMGWVFYCEKDISS